MTEPSPWIVLLLAHGTIAEFDEIPGFLEEIRHGRPAPPELIEEMLARYRAIGGSPLLSQTRRQAEALASRLQLPVRVAMRFSAPRVEDVLRDLTRGERVCLLPAAPLSVPVYEAAARRSLASFAHPPELFVVEPWGHQPALIEHWSSAIRSALTKAGDTARVILTAHSLPTSVIERGDRYQVEFEALARKILSHAEVEGDIAYQSQGASGGSWLGPTLSSALERAASEGRGSVLIAPVGFLCEHVETLFDLDIEAKNQASQLGLRFSRLPTPQAGSGLVTAMEVAVRRVLESA